MFAIPNIIDEKLQANGLQSVPVECFGTIGCEKELYFTIKSKYWVCFQLGNDFCRKCLGDGEEESVQHILCYFPIFQGRKLKFLVVRRFRDLECLIIVQN